MKKNPKRVIVRNSYYTFSKEYPAGLLDTGRRSKRRRQKKKAGLRLLLGAGLFCLVLALSFFVTDLSLQISGRPVSTESTAPAVTNEDGSVQTVLSNGGLRALSMPAQTIADRASVKRSIKQLRRRDCSAVILDFKARDGRLLYASLEQPALLAKAALFSNETVRSAVKQYQNASITVIARVFCFEDPLIAAGNSALAVTYLDTQVPWLDNKEEDGGKPWLNPYSSKARAYLLAVLKEISAFDIGGVILESVCFPTGENLQNATFVGESGGAARSGILQRFLEKARAAIPQGRFLLLGVTKEDLQNGSDVRYDGFLPVEKTDGVFVHTEGTVDPAEKTQDFDPQLHVFSVLKKRLAAGQTLMLDLPFAEYSRRYVRTLEQNGFSYTAVTDETGAYG